MDQDKARPRLDEILAQEGHVSDTQIRIALKHQKVYGGKFGSHLMHHGFIDEAGLVEALAKQFDSNGVVLTDLEIPPAVIKMIPPSVAIARKVVPFAFNRKLNTVKLACEDPTDQSLVKELGFLISGKKIELYVAAEVSLLTALGIHYVGQPAVALKDDRLDDTPPAEQSFDSDAYIIGDLEADDSDKRSALLVSDDEKFSPFIKLLLEEDGLEVFQTDNAKSAIEIASDRKFEAVFIKDTVPGDYLDLIDRLRKNSPQTKIRYYESASALLLNDSSAQSEGRLLTANLELFTSLLSIKDRLSSNHSGRVGGYADKLCRQMALPAKERLAIVCAGFLHDVAKFYHDSKHTPDCRANIRQTVKFLQSVAYDPVVVGILKSMYIDLKGKYRRRLPIEVLGGNILTIIDLYCDNIPAHERLTFDLFDSIRKKLHDLTGKLFLEEVVEAFVHLVEDDILQTAGTRRFNQIMILSDKPERSCALDLRLKSENFRTISALSLDSFLQLYKRSRPDLIIIHVHCDPKATGELVTEISQTEPKDFSIPIFLLVKGKDIPELTPMLESGVEDLIDRDSSLDLLILKIKKIRNNLEKQAAADIKGAERTGSQGHLSDMNLIDLLQALGPSQRTTRIEISQSDESSETLEIFLKKGKIIYAQLGDIPGADAIYRTMGWKDGKWKVEPVTADKLPEPNNYLSNESILMEGCRLIDETSNKAPVDKR